MSYDELLMNVVKSKNRKHKELKVFNNTFEMTIFSSLIKTVLDSGANVVIYEVANYENLFDYADLFNRVRSAREITLDGKKISVIPVTRIPHNVDMMEAVEMSVSNGAIPIIGYFVGDFVHSEHDIKELNEVLMSALFNKVCYVIMFTTNQMIVYDNVPVSRYGVVIEDIAPKIIAEEFPDKRRFADVIGFSKLISMNSEKIAEYATKRKLPTPHTIKFLEKDITFEEMVLPEALKEFIRLNVLTPLKHDFTSVPSLFFIGPHGSGKTTLAYTIAHAVGVPSYLVYVELMTSKWLGESEKIANQTMMMINDRSPVVAVFRDVELLIGGRGMSEDSMVYERMRSIISSWIRSDRRRFVAVFTVSNPREVPDYVLQDATFGVYKLPILPPLTPSDRRTILSNFIRKFSKVVNLGFDPLKQSVSEALDTVAEETWAFTPRELMLIARIAVQIAKEKNLREVGKESIQLARKYVDVDRIARVELMLEAVKACRKVGVPESLAVEVYRFETEVEKLKAEAHAKEAKKRALVSIARE
ncbi:MAG: ATP-binding protein [Ignisphaera sp.]